MIVGELRLGEDSGWIKKHVDQKILASQLVLQATTVLFQGLPESSRPSIHAEVHERITAFCKKLPELNERLGSTKYYLVWQ